MNMAFWNSPSLRIACVHNITQSAIPFARAIVSRTGQNFHPGSLNEMIFYAIAVPQIEIPAVLQIPLVDQKPNVNNPAPHSPPAEMRSRVSRCHHPMFHTPAAVRFYSCPQCHVSPVQSAVFDSDIASCVLSVAPTEPQEELMPAGVK